MDVGIIGGGTAGCAAGLFLARAGHTVTIYERVADPLPIGAGIVLQPTGLAALARLGLFERIVARGARIERLHALTSRGRTVVDLSYAEVQPGLFGIGMHRGALFEALFDAVRAASITLRLGHPIEDLTPADGTRKWCVAPDGTKHGPHDLVILADGARSRLRDDTGIPKSVLDYQWGAIWFVANDPERAYRDELRQIVQGTRVMLGMLPTGLGPGEGNMPVVSLYWSVREDRVEHLRGEGFEAWKQQVERLDPKTAPVLAQLRGGEDLLFSSYKHVTMPRWHEGSVVYLGDAAHAMSPQLGQGANLALYDALVLAESVEAERGDVQRALRRYSATRRAHLRFYQFATRWLTPFFQSDHGWLGALRDVGMGLMTRIKPLRLIMARSMIGVKRGIVRPSLPLPVLPKSLPSGK